MGDYRALVEAIHDKDEETFERLLPTVNLQDETKKYHYAPVGHFEEVKTVTGKFIHLGTILDSLLVQAIARGNYRVVMALLKHATLEQFYKHFTSQALRYFVCYKYYEMLEITLALSKICHSYYDRFFLDAYVQSDPRLRELVGSKMNATPSLYGLCRSHLRFRRIAKDFSLRQKIKNAKINSINK